MECSSPEQEYSTLEGLDFLGLMPCPLKVPFTELFDVYVRERQEKSGVALQCLIESNANKHLDFFSRIDHCRQIDELPAVMMAPGFNLFLYRSFREKFIDKGFFVVTGCPAANSDSNSLDLHDPNGHYSIPCFNPTVMLVDRTNHPDLSLPRRWQDLLEPEYEGLVALRGHQNSNFCEGILLNTYKEHGEEGIRRLGKAAKTGLHPSQMVKLAGSGKAEAPAVSTIPYSFAKLVRPGARVSIVWPEDGAIVNPLLLLVKTECLPQVKKIAEFITGKEIGQIFAAASFPSTHPQVDNNLPPAARFKWLGWDYLQENDPGELVPYLEKIFLSVYLEGKHESGNRFRPSVLRQDCCNS